MVLKSDWRKLTAAARGRAAHYTPTDVRQSLADRVARQRQEAGLTQTQLAKKAGVRVETISRLENALHMPSVRTFEKIDRALRTGSGR
jgi:ribosome-binding protein aMBF1 (putative translation factor)